MSCFPLERTWWVFFLERMQMQWLRGSSLDAFIWTLVFRFWSYSRCSLYMHTDKPGYSYVWIHIGPDFWWQHLLSGMFCFFLQHKAHQLVKSREKWDHWGFIACLALWNGNSYVADVPYWSSGAREHRLKLNMSHLWLVSGRLCYSVKQGSHRWTYRAVVTVMEFINYNRFYIIWRFNGMFVL